MATAPPIAGPLPRDLAAWANPSGRKVRRSADAFLNRALILTRGRREWEAGTLTDEGRARLARALVVYLRDEARAAAELFRDGQLSERQWRDRIAEITGAGSIATTFALQGHRRLNRDDLAELESAIADQVAYLNRFVRQVERGEVPIDGRIVSRSLNYATSPWSAAQVAARSRAARLGFTQERNVLGPAEHCPGCLAEAAKGWQPIGTLVPIGERNCRVGCRCRYEFRGKGARPPAASVTRRPRPAPPPPPTPAVDPSWPPPAGSGADPAVLAARRAWAEARRDRLIADLDDADRRILAGGSRDGREAIADELTRLNGWFNQTKDNPWLIPPGPIRDRVRVYMAGEGGEKLRAIAAVGESLDRLAAEQAEAEAESRRLFGEATAGASPRRRRELRVAIEDADRRAAELGRRYRDALSARNDAAHDVLVVPPAERATLGFGASRRAVSLDVRPDRPSGGLDPVDPTSRADASIRSAREWLELRTRAAGSIPIDTAVGQIRPGDRRRAYATQDGSLVALDREDSADVAAHEFGHILDARLRTGFAGESALARSREFLAARVGDERPRKLADLFPDAGYAADEMGREDEFLAAFREGYPHSVEAARKRAFYAGKDYGPAATEILALGVEELYAHPVQFVRGDPEYAAFVLGILDGSLR